MDLDNIKNAWKNAEIEPNIDENKIKKMLDNKGKSAYGNLLKYERMFLWLLIPCFFFGVFLCFIHLVPAIIYSALLPVSAFWQSYKFRYLKRIDLSEMSVLEVSKSITMYKKFLSYERMIGMVWIIVFMFSYTYYAVPLLTPRSFEGTSDNFLLILCVAGSILAIILTLVMYKCFYTNNIKQIQNAIQEIQDFEKDNE